MSPLISNIGDDDFEGEVLQAETCVLVDFWAPWCGPCMAIMDTLDQIADEYQDRVKVCKLNMDENTDIPTKFAVRSIPYLALFHNGKLVNSLVGQVAKAQLKEMLDAHLSS